MSNILVTGGAGYIGSHTCKALSEAGYTPIVFDNLCYGHKEAVKWGPLEEGDILDGEYLDQVFERYEPKAVIHFAAFAYVGESVEDPAKYYRNNAMGSLSLLEAMQRAGCDKIVFSSTCATYGVPDQMPITEGTPQNPINPYGRTKLFVEGMLNDMETAYGFKSAALRYFNACGGDPEGEIGEDHDPETHLIPNILRALTGDIPHLDLYGTDYPTPDGTCVRDYIHVNDLAEAHILALKHLLEDGDSLRLNLGVGKGFSVREIINAAERVTGETVAVKEGPRRAGDPAELIADASAIKRTLGFTPKFVDIDEIVRTAWNWHCRNK